MFSKKLFFIFSFLPVIAFSSCKIAIDTGHTPGKSGATSARGVSEFRFNELLVTEIEKELNTYKNIEVKKINSSQKEVSLSERVKESDKWGADLFVSIHHDSVNKKFLKNWKFLSKNRKYCDKFKGYTVIVSPKNKEFKSSLKAAKSIGRELLLSGRKPSKHHMMKIKGENRKYYSPTYGVMKYDNLAVLRLGHAPAVLIEAGVILHREEELEMSDPDSRKDFAEKVSKGIIEWCKVRGN